MVEAATIRLVNELLSLLVLAGLLYLLDFEVRRLAYGWEPVAVTVAAILLVLESGLRGFVSANTHVIHAVAAFVLVIALYDPVRNRIRIEEWADLLLRHPLVGPASEQYSPRERRVLELLADSNLVLTPEVVAENLNQGEAGTAASLEQLAADYLLETVDLKKYRITPLGRRYLRVDEGAIS